MISILIIGNGNVATHLYKALLNIATVKVLKISSRNITVVPQADISILAVSDNAIAAVSSKIINSFVVHTSGSFPMEALQNETNKGVFYLLQTFSKEKPIDFSKIPICIETTNKENYALLETLAKTLSKNVYAINSEQRKALHVAAVFVNNFTNHLYTIGKDLCKNNQVPFEILQPLIQETAEKIKTLSPEEAQTGPAIRNDQKTIDSHLAMLNPNQQNIYSILTKSIQNGN
ncbi:DUF2520 domain-containing protein [Polaribacter sp. HL-MS24]|uniref:Rossmann-like and DUF2520 domain-containing protein n=1 Tax=Polaribacter sp. HL-MS24 TaxID=3077735 RepID=UPI002934AAF6|nr:DUF2520 domain-containing protein [Polaribacter sp. HL-MS24]WOC40048.1 DUF2520 domain-containing protein [Polaribacter sp. HL-MS24]